MASTDGSSICGEVFHHLTPDLETCTEPCAQPVGHRPDTPHRCASGHEWLIDAHGLSSDTDSAST
jgi:hypothetical protein